MRYNAQDRFTGLFLQKFHGRLQQSHIPAEFIDDEPLDQGLFFFIQELQRTNERSQGPAAINIRNEQYRGLQVLRHPHVHDVIGLEINLSRTPRALDDDRIVFRRQAVQCLRDCRKGLERVTFVIFPRGHITDRTALQDDLGTGISRGLQQYRIHVHHRLEAGRFSLGYLCPPHFQSLFGDIGIQRHILGLEGNNPASLPIKNAAERSRQYAFPHMRTRALQHDVICHNQSSQFSAKRRMFTASPQATR